MMRKSRKPTVVGMDHIRSISEGRPEWRFLQPIAVKRTKRLQLEIVQIAIVSPMAR